MQDPTSLEEGQARPPEEVTAPPPTAAPAMEHSAPPPEDESPPAVDGSPAASPPAEAEKTTEDLPSPAPASPPTAQPEDSALAPSPPPSKETDPAALEEGRTSPMEAKPARLPLFPVGAYYIGQRVEAKYSGGKHWFLGTIAEQKEPEAFEVALDKGGKLLVPPPRLRAYTPPPPGSHVVRFLKRWGGGQTWIRGVVIAHQPNGHFHIRYEEDIFETGVLSSAVRVMPGTGRDAEDAAGPTGPVSYGDRVEALAQVGGWGWEGVDGRGSV
jgi:hypothetical protein